MDDAQGEMVGSTGSAVAPGAGSGQALVEFALVLPLLLLVVIGIFEFGKAINYWIDQNQIASEGARWVAVNKVPGGGATSRTRVRGLHSLTGRDAGAQGSRRHQGVLPERHSGWEPRDRGGDLELQPAPDHQHRDDQDHLQGHDADRAGADDSERMGHGMLRARLARDERGSVLAFVVVAIPVLLVMMALVIDVGNWFSHKRNLQTKADAGALAAATAYGGRLPACSNWTRT